MVKLKGRNATKAQSEAGRWVISRAPDVDRPRGRICRDHLRGALDCPLPATLFTQSEAKVEHSNMLSWLGSLFMGTSQPSDSTVTDNSSPGLCTVSTAHRMGGKYDPQTSLINIHVEMQVPTASTRSCHGTVQTFLFRLHRTKDRVKSAD